MGDSPFLLVLDNLVLDLVPGVYHSFVCHWYSRSCLKRELLAFFITPFTVVCFPHFLFLDLFLCFLGLFTAASLVARHLLLIFLQLLYFLYLFLSFSQPFFIFFLDGFLVGESALLIFLHLH